MFTFGEKTKCHFAASHETPVAYDFVRKVAEQTRVVTAFFVNELCSIPDLKRNGSRFFPTRIVVSKKKFLPGRVVCSSGLCKL